MSLARTVDLARGVARKAGAGRALLRLQRAYRFGLKVEVDTLVARARYLKAVVDLPPLDVGAGKLDCFMLLNGPRFWEGLWSLYSFRFHFGACRLVVLNDGTLNPASIARLHALFPGIAVPDFNALNERVAAYLAGRCLHRCAEWRRRFVLFRKVTDPVALAAGNPVLLLDSDCLHFARPQETQEWTERPEKILYIRDVARHSLCGPADELARICGQPLPDYFCSGYLGLPQSAVNLEQIETYLAEDVLERQRAHGFSHFAEQSLLAMQAAVQGAQALPPRYATCPDPRGGDVVMGHFCGGAPTRTWFYTLGLPLMRAQLAAAAS